MSEFMVVGNGPSREGLDLNKFIGKLPVIGCNALARDYPDVDYIAYMDPGVRRELDDMGFPVKRMLIPTMKDEFEPPEYGVSRFKNNAGVFAMKNAVMMGATKVYVLGIDCMYKTDNWLKNVYSDTNNYNVEGVHVEDQIRRQKYVDWFCSVNPKVKFIFAVPDSSYGFHPIVAKNITGMTFESLEKKYA